MADQTRRDFLKTSTSTILAACGLIGLESFLRFLSFSTEPPPTTEFILGKTSEYPIGSRTELPDVPALLVHDEQGLSALSLVCPHLGCTVQDGTDGFYCPCHGSRFDPDGVVQRGPATDALRALRVEITDDEQIRLFVN